MSDNIHRCAYIEVMSADLVTHCGRYVQMRNHRGVPLCRQHAHEEVGPEREVVYFIAWGDYVKVGTTRLDPRDRMKLIAQGSTKNPPDVHGVPVLLAAVLGSQTTEQVFHAILAPHRAEGEWFRREGQVEALVEWVNKRYGVRPLSDEEVGQEPEPAVVPEVESSPTMELVNF